MIWPEKLIIHNREKIISHPTCIALNVFPVLNIVFQQHITHQELLRELHQPHSSIGIDAAVVATQLGIERKFRGEVGKHALQQDWVLRNKQISSMKDSQQ